MKGSNPPALVIDFGYGSTKMGFAGTDYPRTSQPTCLGNPRRGTPTLGSFTHIGTQALSKRNILTITNGTQMNWSQKAEFLELLMQVEHANVSGQPLLLIHSTLLAQEDHQHLSQIFFEKLNAPILCLQPDSVMSLYAEGLSTGLVVDIGASGTRVTPIYRGTPLLDCFCSNQIGGDILVSFYQRLFALTGCSSSLEAFQDSLHQDCRVAWDYKAVSERGPIPKHIQLGDLSVALLDETWKVPEALFQPSLILEADQAWSQAIPAAGAPIFLPPLPNKVQPDDLGVHELIFECYKKCPESRREKIFSNILLCGGSSVFPGLKERLSRELCPTVGAGLNGLKLLSLTKTLSKDKTCLLERVPRELRSLLARYVVIPDLVPMLTNPVHQKCSSWVGGSKFAKSTKFKPACVTKEEYLGRGSKNSK